MIVCWTTRWPELSSNEHFSIDGTRLDAWASHKSFVRKDGGSNPPDDNTRNPGRDFKGERRSNATHMNRLLILAHAWHARATGTAEREESHKLLQVNAKLGATAGEHCSYDTDAHIARQYCTGWHLSE